MINIRPLFIKRGVSSQSSAQRRHVKWRVPKVQKLQDKTSTAIEITVPVSGDQKIGTFQIRKEIAPVRRKEEEANGVDRRARRNEEQQDTKRRRLDGTDALPIYATKFSVEEIAAQERKPKKKVAVLIGYSGSGYKGLQLNNREKTIEGDLFSAFVKAGAISKANADDPKKSSLVRCARTDKGVHAAGNVISLKLVVEEADLVRKINEHLSPQIRVWAINRTNSSFSAYQAVDSRIYEYLIPSYCFLPPHPKSFLGQQMRDLAAEEHDETGYNDRQSEVIDFWAETEKKWIIPVLESLDDRIREKVFRSFFSEEEPEDSTLPKSSEDPPPILGESENAELSEGQATGNNQSAAPLEATLVPVIVEQTHLSDPLLPDSSNTTKQHQPKTETYTPTERAYRDLKLAVSAARKAYRISPARMDRIQTVLSLFVGSHRFHNYTIDKSPRDPSSTRVMKSVTLSKDPVMIGNTEWLSIKIHGQSFMMHQIRKMISAVALIVRCGCPAARLQDTYLPERLNIPKAPSLGLLLERPLFDVYNERLIEFGRDKIEFETLEKEISEFKQREIYNRIFECEEQDGTFMTFFAGLDVTRDATLLWLSSAGLRAIKMDIAKGGNIVAANANGITIQDESSDDEQAGQDEN